MDGSSTQSMARGMAGFSIEVHRDIEVDPPLAPADFAPTVELDGEQPPS